jgi:hypothetical protein
MALSAEVKFMSTTVTERKSQTERAIERTEKLLDELKRASDIVDTKDARHHDVRLGHRLLGMTAFSTGDQRIRSALIATQKVSG